MQVTAEMVKTLRERTGAGMMECKNALNEVAGDMDQAIDLMRKSGQAKAVKKQGRIAAEGRIALAEDATAAALVEINTETDFAAKDDHLVAFADQVAACVLRVAPADLAALMAAAIEPDGPTVEEARQALVAKVGENIQVRRFARVDGASGVVGSYLHGIRIGVVVLLAGGNATLARDLGMHIAASRPQYLDEGSIPAEVLAKEKEILVEQAASSGKPPEIVEKMIAGRLQKQLAELTLLGQIFVKDPEQKRTVAELIKAEGATIRQYVRFEVGEGVEKEQTDFAAEVMAQVKGD